MNSAVEDIKARINIVDLIGEYIRLQKSGSGWKGLCPFHREKSPSFTVSEEKQFWHCFGCHKGGDVFSFINEIEGLEFKETLKMLAEKTGVELPVFSKSQVQATDDRKKILEILELSVKFYEKQLWDGAGKEKIMAYLRGRGLTDASIKEFHLGYAPRGWNNLLKFLVGRGYAMPDIAKTGLLVEKSKISNNQFKISQPEADPPMADNKIPNSSFYDRFRDRITFPIMDVMGNAVGFSARVAPGGDESQAKYVNTPETAVYHKSKILYGLSGAKRAIKEKNSVVIVEGNMDVIAAHQAGIKNTVAVSGTALTEEHVDTLKRYANKIKMLFDMDSAGKQATKRSAEICFKKDVDISVITLEGGKDAAEIVQKNPKEFVKSVENAVPAMEHFFTDSFKKFNKDNVGDKKAIASELLNIIKNFGSAIEKSHWIKKLARKLEVEEKILLDTLKKVERRLQGKFKKEERAAPKISKTRAEIIREKIVGLMLAHPNVWKDIAADPSKNGYFKNDLRFKNVFEKGLEAQYAFDRLISIAEDEETKDFLQKLYFETLYPYGNGEESKESDPVEIKEQLDYYFSELRKETGKEKLKVLSCDIQKAEEEKDREGKNLLINEFNKLSQEVK